MTVAKIAVTIDPELLARVEAVRSETRESRSAVVSRALRQLLQTREHEEQVQRYVEAYRDYPESAADVDRARDLASQALATVPWESE